MIEPETPGVGARQLRVAVVGAGIAGLTAAFRLVRHGCEVVVYEAAQRVGGRMDTVHERGFTFDTGAIVLSRRYDRMLALAAEAGLSDEVVAVTDALAIPRDGTVGHVHAGSPLRNLATSALSPREKLSAVALVRDVRRLASSIDWDDLSSAVRFDHRSVHGAAAQSLHYSTILGVQRICHEVPGVRKDPRGRVVRA